MPKVEYTMSEIAKILKIKRTRLQEWVERRHICPSSISKGQGSKNLFSIHDVRKIALFESLLVHGFSRNRAAQFITFVDFLYNQKSTLWDSGYLAIRATKETIFSVAVEDASVCTLDIREAHEAGILYELFISLRQIKENVDNRLTG